MRYAIIGNRKDTEAVKSLVEQIMAMDEPAIIIVGTRNVNNKGFYFPEPKLHNENWISEIPLGLGMIQETENVMNLIREQTTTSIETKFGTTYISPNSYFHTPTKVIEPEEFGKPKYIKKPKGRKRHPNIASQKKAKIRKNRR